MNIVKKSQRKSRGEFLLSVLESIAETALTVFDIADMLITTPYRSSSALGRVFVRVKQKSDKRYYTRQDMQRYYRILNHLQKQGFVARMKQDTRSLWKLTQTGRQKIKDIRHSPRRYAVESDNETKIIIFDIPEKEKKQRNWLRAALQHIQFTILQKSVWIGTSAIPKEFLADLHERKLMSYIQIFAITKRGTLENMLLP